MKWWKSCHWWGHDDDDDMFVTPEMLHWACVNNNIKLLKRFGRRGHYIHSPDPLCDAAQDSNIELMKCLVKFLGAKVNEPGCHGWTPLQIAAMNNDLKTTRCLVEELDARVEQVMYTGNNALETAIEYQSTDVITYLDQEMRMIEEQFV